MWISSEEMMYAGVEAAKNIKSAAAEMNDFFQPLHKFYLICNRPDPKIHIGLLVSIIAHLSK